MKNATASKGFFFLNATQFFGAANDNILKQVLIFGVATGGLWAGKLGDGAQAYASLCLAIPFVIFSGFAGQFSDRFSKRSVSIVVKIVEVFVAGIAMWGLCTTNVWLVLLGMVLISVQSAFFTPAKFGILPEIAEPGKLSRANGTINMFTYIAIILGGAVGGPIYDAYAPDQIKFPNAEPVLWLPGLILVLVATSGAFSSCGIPRVAAKNPKLKITPTFFKTYFETWRSIRGTALSSVIIAWSMFYMIMGGVAILILPDYKDLLGISATKTALLMASLGISIGIGDFVAGRLSGHGIRPALIPVGAIPTTAMFFLLAFLPANFPVVVIALSVTGFLAGFVMVPLQTLTQHLAPEERRGQVLGLWNCLSFIGVIVGNLLFLGIKQFGVPSHRMFIVCGLLCVAFLVTHFLRWQPIYQKAIASSK